jgi:CheY-like chemotaxis protein
VTARPEPRILIAEDEAIVSMLIEDVLSAMGCHVVGPAGRLDEALALAAAEPLEGAVLDVNLAGAAVHPAAELPAGRGIPFLLVTGYEARHLPPEGQSRPLLHKPFDPEQLRQALQRVLSGAT